MAVTIDEMQVEVAEPKPTAGAAPAAGAKKPVDVRSALEMLDERKRRLTAD